ncbi:MAG: hypothetical protein ACX94A_07395, partial [Algiphilus sp.]
MEKTPTDFPPVVTAATKLRRALCGLLPHRGDAQRASHTAFIDTPRNKNAMTSQCRPLSRRFHPLAFAFLGVVVIIGGLLATQSARATPLLSADKPTLAPMLEGVLPAVVNIKI